MEKNVFMHNGDEHFMFVMTVTSNILRLGDLAIAKN